MSSYLFTTWDGGGNNPPLTDLAGALVRRGHDVRIMGDPVLHDDIVATGAEHVAWTRAPHRAVRTRETEIIRDWEFRTPMGSFKRLSEELLCGPAARFVADVHEELDRRPADVIVTEMALPSVVLAAEARGVPSVVLYTTVLPLPTPGIPPFGAGLKPARGPLGRARDRVLFTVGNRMWNTGLPAINAERAAHGLPLLDNALDQLRATDRALVLTSSAFDFEATALPANVRYVGPRLADPAWSEPWTPPPGDAPLVLVGLSTTFQDQLAVVRRVADALGRLPVRAVVTTGPEIDPADVAAPQNVQVVRSAPHAAVLEHASAVVTHAGHGTVAKALAAGVPLVCLPMGRDQLDVATRVQVRGAGLRLSPKASAAKLAGAIRTVLDDPAYAAAARRLAGAIAEETREDLAVEELEALADARVPAVA